MTRQEELERFERFSALTKENGTFWYAAGMLQRATQRFGNSTALIFKQETMSYNELYSRSCLITHQLLTHYAIKPGDRILLMFENSITFYILYFGIWQTGAVIAPLNIFLKPDELAHIVHDANPALIISCQEKKSFFKNHHCPLITNQDLSCNQPLPKEIPAIIIPTIDPGKMAALLYTSGTTGFPKGVMLSSSNILSNLAQGFARIPLEFGQRVLAPLPLFHSFAQLVCVWGSMFGGCTVIVIPKIERGTILEGLKHKPTVFLGVPALFGLLCLFKKAELSDIDYFISGGDAMPDKIRMGFELIYRRKIAGGYGLTETSPVLCADFDDVLQSTDTVGRPLLEVSCSIRDEQNNELPQGEIGILWVKGPNIMLGYYNAPETTADMIQDGWLNTGDLAKITLQGKVIICGRDKDVIAHKGFKIYPQEIENVIMSYPSIISVGVVGKKDVETGEIPVAFVQTREKIAGLPEILHKLCEKHLAMYKVPKQFIVISEMPLTSTGKVDKKVLRAQLNK